MPHRLDRCFQLLLAAAIVSSPLSCGKSSPDSSYERRELKTPALQSTSKTSTDRKPPSVKYIGQNQIEIPAWLEAAREDPDPRVRLHAIETWAINPGDNVNPFTYALVDPDESVRARAQELFEEELARR